MNDLGIVKPFKFSGKEKTYKHKQSWGIVPGLGGWQTFVSVFLGSFRMGRKRRNKIPRKSRDSPVNILFMCVFLRWFVCSQY